MSRQGVRSHRTGDQRHHLHPVCLQGDRSGREGSRKASPLKAITERMSPGPHLSIAQSHSARAWRHTCRGDRLTLRNCKVSDTSTEGIYILSSSDVLLERNIFTRNNIEQITGYYPAAVKIFNQCYRVTCRDNLIPICRSRTASGTM